VDPPSTVARGLGTDGRASALTSDPGSPTEPMRIIGPRPTCWSPWWCSWSSRSPHVECSRQEGCSCGRS